MNMKKGILQIIISATRKANEQQLIGNAVKKNLDLLIKNYTCDSSRVMLVSNLEMTKMFIRALFLEQGKQFTLAIGSKGFLEGINFPNKTYREIHHPDGQISIYCFARIKPGSEEQFFQELMESQLHTWCVDTLDDIQMALSRQEIEQLY